MRRAAPKSRQRGAVAILFALLIVALTASVAAAISYDVALDVRRTNAMLLQEQARLVALGAEDWIGDLLRQDAVDTEDDHLGELWAQELPPLPIEGAGPDGIISGQIIDLQSRFNLNNMIDGEGQPVELEVDRFKRMLTNNGLNPELSDAVLDWMDGDQDFTFPSGAEDDVYTSRLPPMRAANQAFRSVNELAAVEGFDKAAMDLLRPHLTALPSQTPININTATPVVMQSLDESMTPAVINELREVRLETGFDDLSVQLAGSLPADTIATLGTQSEY
ncbi:MAG: type II secretion system minor pseudopilin GspK, partial [Pseudomonadota bacterium]